ncbi:endothelin-converting enzyme 1-like [Euwallacea similis]|uniref:endothelin-converting enzyme 1-like n=1 Tax=Euwallacea similis TaxID=1736056 RepID=UPI00345067D3
MNLLLAITTLLMGVSGYSIGETYISNEEFQEFQYMNLTADPCEDFYEYTCGNFKNVHPIKEGDSLIDQFTLLEEKLTRRVFEMLNSDDQDCDPVAVLKAKGALKACVSDMYTNAIGIVDPEGEVVRRYGGFPILGDEHMANFYSGRKSSIWNDIADIAAEFGISVFFTASLYFDIQNATRNLLRISTDAMEIPVQFRPAYDRSYDKAIEEGFKNLESSSNRLSNAKEKSIPAMEVLLRNLSLKLNRIFGNRVNDEEIFVKVANISNFLKGIYYGGYIPEGTEIDPLTNDSLTSVVTLKHLNEWTEKYFGDSIQLDWVEYIQRLLKYTYVDVDENFEILATTNLSTVLYGVINWIRINDMDIVKSAALLRAFTYTAADSDSETRNYFDEYMKTIQKPTYDRWEYCSRKIMDASGSLALSLAVADDYRLEYMGDNLLDSAATMIDNLQASFEKIIDEASWMDDTSKASAQVKAANIISLLGYPKFIQDKHMLNRFYENLQISTWDHFSNAKVLRSFQSAYTLNMISLRKKTAWEKSPFDVNAYYNRANNRIIFPLAMLHPIFFQGNTSLLDYSRIGMIISHEITHGFDYQGYLYNEDGVMQPWWSNETTANFRNLSQCFVEQYSKYVIPEINGTLSGSGSLNENVADNGGLRNAFKTFQNLLPNFSSKYVISSTKQFSAEQLFFVGYGTMWCSAESDAYLVSLQQSCLTSSSCHARASMRVNGVLSNMDSFAEAFECPVGSPMNPEEKCKLW